MLTLKLIEATFFVGQNVKLRDDMIVRFDIVRFDADCLCVVSKGTELVVKRISIMEDLFGENGREAVHYDIYKENDLRMYEVKTVDPVSIPTVTGGASLFELVSFEVTEDMIKKVKTDKPKKQKLSPTAVHQDFNAKDGSEKEKRILSFDEKAAVRENHEKARKIKGEKKNKKKNKKENINHNLEI